MTGSSRSSVEQKKGQGSDGKLIAIDLFSGCGGLTLGLKQAGFHVAAAVEIDVDAAKCYRANHPEVVLFQRDIRKVLTTELMGASEHPVSLVAACPPCQGFSRIRTRNAQTASSDARNTLYREFLRVVEGLLPDAVMLENVPMFAEGYRFRILKQKLRQLGYVISHEVLNAADYGVPQRRNRLILVGLRSKGAAPPLSRPAEHRVSVGQILSSLSKDFLDRDSLHNLPQNFSETVKRRIRAIPKNGGGRVSLSSTEVLPCHKALSLRSKRSGFFDVYGRMRWDDVAPTITAGVYTPSKGRFLHPTEDRCISLREASIIQTFPLSYIFPLSIGKMSLAALIGNALPPEFIRRHAISLREAMVASREQKTF